MKLQPHSTLRKRTTIASAALLLFISSAVFAETAQTRAQVTAYQTQIGQLTLEIENKKLQMLEAKTQNNARSAQNYETEMQRLSATLAYRRQELSIWQQQASFENQPPNPNQAIQAVKLRIQQLTFEKAYLALQQTQASQTGRQQQADEFGRQITKRQNEIQMKNQEIRILELKAKAAVPQR